METHPQTIPAAAGYILNFNGRGYSPDGVVGAPSQADIDAHNSALAAAELAHLKATGRGVLYLGADGQVTQWAGKLIGTAHHQRKSWHNMAGRDGRTDVWFEFDGSTWHGVNIGDSQILRVRRTKGGSK